VLNCALHQEVLRTSIEKKLYVWNAVDEVKIILRETMIELSMLLPMKSGSSFAIIRSRYEMLKRSTKFLILDADYWVSESRREITIVVFCIVLF
jgi:hypothetical protein